MGPSSLILSPPSRRATSWSRLRGNHTNTPSSYSFNGLNLDQTELAWFDRRLKTHAYNGCRA
jgi:hypothetical protein